MSGIIETAHQFLGHVCFLLAFLFGPVLFIAGGEPEWGPVLFILIIGIDARKSD